VARLETSLVGFAAAALICSAASAAATTVDRSSGNDPQGVALLARVHQAYRSVAGVSIAGKTGALSFEYTLNLRSGIGVAEEFVGRQPSGTTVLVAHGRPTYVFDSGRACWTALSASAPQTFENLGLHFPDQPGMSVKAPARTATGWSLTLVSDGTPGTLEIDRTSLHIRSLTVKTPSADIVEHVTILSSAPQLPEPEPRC
jgi:hypothetical protein